MASAPNEIEIKFKAVLEVIRPGDTIVLGVGSHKPVSHKQAADMERYIRDIIPDVDGIVILPVDAIAAYRPDERTGG